MKNKSGLTRFLGEYSYIFVFVIILIVYMITNNGITWPAAMNILRHSAAVGIIAVGMGMICLTGDIDLSVGSMLAIVSGFSVVIFNITNSVLLTLLFSLAFGAVLGLLNGMLVGRLEIPAFIATLATMLIFRSLAQYFCQHIGKELIGGGSSVYKMVNANSQYKPFYNFGNGKLFTVPNVGLILIVVTVLFVYISTSTKFGKKVYAVGSNPKAALMTGISVPHIKVVVFTITGLLVGLGSFVWIGMNASCDPATTGNSYEMYAISAVVLGGISMSGGKGRILGVLFGAMSYTVIDKIIVALKMDSLINNAIKGVILLVVIAIQIVTPKIRAKLRKA